MHLAGVTVSMRVMSAGAGYRYLLRSVAVGDAEHDKATALTRYYAQTGTPPGRWLGSGVAGLEGDVAAGDVVSEDQLRLLLGQGRHPVTGEPLGRAYPVYKPLAERVRERVARLDPGLSDRDRADAAAAIEADESRHGTRRAVAGYDFTASAPKSVSVLWSIADEATRERIVRAHHAAIGDVVALIEREVAATRIGDAGADGAVAQADVTGVIATAFDHWDSRAGDPQLHTHIVIANKVRTVRDGAWRALDGRPLHAAVVAVSEHYNAVLADRLTRELGLHWQARARGDDRNPAWEIAAVPGELVSVFSSRAGQIDTETDRLIDEYVAAHGHRPSADVVVRLRAQATLATRPEKAVRPLAELTREWQQRASATLGTDAAAWAQRLHDDATAAAQIRADEVNASDVETLGQRVVHAVQDKRSTWRRWNLHAEASRQSMHLRMASTADREALVERIVHAAERASVRLTPPELAAVPRGWRRADGSSMLRPRHADVFTSAALLEAEARLLHLARTTTAPRADATRIAAPARRGHARTVLGADQQQAVARVAGSGRVVDVLVGAAGTGKTTALRGLRQAWETAHGPGSVVGLGTSAKSAAVLSADLGVPCENTAKWLHEHHAGRWRLHRGHLVIVDESSMADTRTLDTITAHAAIMGAKMLLVGDWAQLSAVDAGGAFGLLVREREDPPELSRVRRFHHDWERAASMRLRCGDSTVIDTYERHDRIVQGEHDDMLHAAITAWRRDTHHGHLSVMIADTTDTVTTLASRARAERVLAGQVDATREVSLHDGTMAGVGDLIVTRHNNRMLVVAGRGWVRNGDHWTVTAIGRDGSITAHRAQPGGGEPGRGPAVQLPAAYVAEHVELGYAATVHRAQGITVGTVHAVVASSTTRESFYVAMTRGRISNTAYVATDQADLEEHQQLPDDDMTARHVLTSVLARVGAEASAHETLRAEQDRWASIAQLAGEYDTLATDAQRERWTKLIRTCGLTSDQVAEVLDSPAFGPLAAALRRAETHVDIESLLPQLTARHSFDDADDIASALHHRVVRATQRPSITQHQRADLIAGLIPAARGPMPPDMRAALDERRTLIEQRAVDLATEAVRAGHAWTRHLPAPSSGPQRTAWLHHLATIAAYRDRYRITTDDPLGPTPDHLAQRADAVHARHALTNARRLTRPTTDTPTHHAVEHTLQLP